MTAKFSLGQLVATPGALWALEKTGQTAAEFIARHAAGDWGTVNVSDQRANERSLVDGSRLLSAYLLADGTKIWVITEAVGDGGKRASTCLLLPSEY